MVYVDMFQAPFDYQAFDNLPLSEATPSTFTDRMPKGLVKHSFSMVKESADMCHKNLMSFFATKLDKHLKDPEMTLIIDSYDSLIAG